MKLGDIIALAKLGYKKEDIQELISMADTVEDDISTATENPENAAGQEEPESSSPEKEPEKSADQDTEQLKALEDQITDLKKQLDAAQKQNIRKDNSNGVPAQQSVQDRLNEIARNFM